MTTHNEKAIVEHIEDLQALVEKMKDCSFAAIRDQSQLKYGK